MVFDVKELEKVKELGEVKRDLTAFLVEDDFKNLILKKVQEIEDYIDQQLEGADASKPTLLIISDDHLGLEDALMQQVLVRALKNRGIENFYPELNTERIDQIKRGDFESYIGLMEILEETTPTGYYILSKNHTDFNINEAEPNWKADNSRDAVDREEEIIETVGGYTDKGDGALYVGTIHTKPLAEKLADKYNIVVINTADGQKNQYMIDYNVQGLPPEEVNERTSYVFEENILHLNLDEKDKTLIGKITLEAMAKVSNNEKPLDYITQKVNGVVDSYYESKATLQEQLIENQQDSIPSGGHDR